MKATAICRSSFAFVSLPMPRLPFSARRAAVRPPARTSASDLSVRARSRGGDVAGAALGTRWNSLHCRQNQREQRGFSPLPLGGDVEMGTSQNPASGRRGFSFNALNLFHLLTSSFRAERAKRYNWNASQQGIFLLIGYAGGMGGLKS